MQTVAFSVEPKHVFRVHKNKNKSWITKHPFIRQT